MYYSCLKWINLPLTKVLFSFSDEWFTLLFGALSPGLQDEWGSQFRKASAINIIVTVRNLNWIAPNHSNGPWNKQCVLAFYKNYVKQLFCRCIFTNHILDDKTSYQILCFAAVFRLLPEKVKKKKKRKQKRESKKEKAKKRKQKRESKKRESKKEKAKKRQELYLPWTSKGWKRKFYSVPPKFWTVLVHISRSINLITLGYISLERPCSASQFENTCPLSGWKVMTSQAGQMSRSRSSYH